MPKWAFGVLAGCRCAAPGSFRRLAGAAGRWNGVEGRYTRSLRGQGVCGDCFGPLTHQERLLIARMVVLVLASMNTIRNPANEDHRVGMVYLPAT